MMTQHLPDSEKRQYLHVYYFFSEFLDEKFCDKFSQANWRSEIFFREIFTWNIPQTVCIFVRCLLLVYCQFSVSIRLEWK